MQLSFKFQSSANHYMHLILAPNGEILTAYTFITRSTVFFMISFPQKNTFCSICIIWQTALLKTHDTGFNHPISASYLLMFPAGFSQHFPHRNHSRYKQHSIRMVC